MSQLTMCSSLTAYYFVFIEMSKQATYSINTWVQYFHVLVYTYPHDAKHALIAQQQHKIMA